MHQPRLRVQNLHSGDDTQKKFFNATAKLSLKHFHGHVSQPRRRYRLPFLHCSFCPCPLSFSYELHHKHIFLAGNRLRNSHARVKRPLQVLELLTSPRENDAPAVSFHPRKPGVAENVVQHCIKIRGAGLVDFYRQLSFCTASTYCVKDDCFFAATHGSAQRF